MLPEIHSGNEYNQQVADQESDPEILALEQCHIPIPLQVPSQPGKHDHF